MKTIKKVLNIVGIIFCVLAAVCLFEVWISYNLLTVTNYSIEDPKIKNPIKMVLIADLHDHVFGKNNEKLVQMIEKESPDFIVMDGDMINKDSTNADIAINLIRSLKDMYPVYYSLGNHEIEYMRAGHTDLVEELTAAGAVVLDHNIIDCEINENNFRFGSIYEYGFETNMQSEADNQKALSYKEEYMSGQSEDLYTIMCAHRPESFYPWSTADDWNLDLIVSGHLHGGQVIIPFVGGLYSNLEGYFPKYDYGIFQLGNATQIISRGLSSNIKKLPRFNNPPEIVVIEIQPLQ